MFFRMQVLLKRPGNLWQAVNRQANRMSELINQLLFFAREENGTLAVNFEKTEILPVLQEILGDCRPLCQKVLIFRLNLRII